VRGGRRREGRQRQDVLVRRGLAGAEEGAADLAGALTRPAADVRGDRDRAPRNEAARLHGHGQVSGVELTVERVRKTFEDGRVVALDELSLEAAAGEFVAVTGPSGCGKSTLLNLVGALDRPDSGEIWVGRERVDVLRDPAEYRAETVGFVFQFHNLVPVLSAAENVQVPMIGRGRRRAE